MQNMPSNFPTKFHAKIAYFGSILITFYSLVCCLELCDKWKNMFSSPFSLVFFFIKKKINKTTVIAYFSFPKIKLVTLKTIVFKIKIFKIRFHFLMHDIELKLKYSKLYVFKNFEIRTPKR